MPRQPAWQTGHAHEHTNRYPEHEHGENSTEEAIDLEHAVLFPTHDAEEDFDQGPEANRTIDQSNPLTGVPGTDDGPPTGAPLTARGGSSDGQVAQTGFGDHVVNVEDEEGLKFLALLDERSEIRELASRYNAVNADIKKQLANRGISNGSALRIRVGAHILNLSDKSDDKDVEATTREGSQRLLIVHPE